MRSVTFPTCPRRLAATAALADESSLTGVYGCGKGMDGALFSGTGFKRGEANTVVVAK
ncbi:MAG: hypothetical protein JRN09_04390 [Nitrososphaerota archaeon]|nr:hypothetical protein [Nitrososphaerota archaeon]